MRKPRWLILLLVTLLLASFVSTAFADSTYTVQPGDSLAAIARQFGTNYLVLAAANDLEEPYVIQVGQVLVIPGDGEMPAAEEAAPPVQEAPVQKLIPLLKRPRSAAPVRFRPRNLPCSTWG